jgi:hypothetical protein
LAPVQAYARNQLLAKTVTIDVGIIINPGWRELLEARGYVYLRGEGAWVKTIKL